MSQTKKPPVLRVSNLRLHPSSPAIRAKLLPGELVAVLGASNSGRRRFLQLLRGEIEPPAGRVERQEPPLINIGESGGLYILTFPEQDLDPSAREALWQKLRQRADSGSAVLVASEDWRQMETHVDRVWILDENQLRDQSGLAATLEKHGRPLIAGAAETPAAAACLRLLAHELDIEPLGGPRGRWIFDVVDRHLAERFMAACGARCPDVGLRWVERGLEAVRLRVSARSHGRRSRS